MLGSPSLLQAAVMKYLVNGGMGGWAGFLLEPASKEPSFNMLFQVKPGGQGLQTSHQDRDRKTF